jgi:hypothetical protein
MKRGINGEVETDEMKLPIMQSRKEWSAQASVCGSAAGEVGASGSGQRTTAQGLRRARARLSRLGDVGAVGGSRRLGIARSGQVARVGRMAGAVLLGLASGPWHGRASVLPLGAAWGEELLAARSGSRGERRKGGTREQKGEKGNFPLVAAAAGDRGARGLGLGAADPCWALVGQGRLVV